MLNHFRTGQGLCAVNLHKWGLVSCDKCGCGTVQTMSHTVNKCPVIKLHDGGLQSDAVNWMGGTMMIALVRQTDRQKETDTN